MAIYWGSGHTESAFAGQEITSQTDISFPVTSVSSDFPILLSFKTWDPKYIGEPDTVSGGGGTASPESWE